jgi:hypothetical protein
LFIERLFRNAAEGKAAHAHEFCFAAPRSQSFPPQGNEGVDEVPEHIPLRREHVEIEVKRLPGGDRAAIEVAGAEYEWPRPIRKA